MLLSENPLYIGKHTLETPQRFQAVVRDFSNSTWKQLSQPNLKLANRNGWGRVIYKRCSHIVELFLRIECSGEYPIYYNNQESGRPSKRRERTATPKAIIEKAFAVDSPFTITKSNLSKKYPTSQPIKVQKAVKKI